MRQLAVLFFAVLCVSSGAKAQLSHDALQTRLRADATSVSRARRVVGPLSLAAGALMLAPSLAAWADGAYEARPNVGYLAAGVAALGLFQGVVWLGIETAAEERLRRFEAQCDSGCSELERARYEGELRADRAVARMERALIMWSGIGLMFGGTLYAAVQSQVELPRGHTALGYGAAGASGAIGLGLLIRSFLPLRRERIMLGGAGDAGLSLALRF